MKSMAFLFIALFVVIIAIVYYQSNSSKRLHVFIIRHGQRVDQKNPELRNITFDPVLSDIGEQQAKETANLLRSIIPQQANVLLFSSPYERCLQTSQQISGALNKIPIHMEPGVGEYVFNAYVWNEAKLPKFRHLDKFNLDKSYTPTIDFDKWFTQRLNFVEPLNEYESRVKQSYRRFLSFSPDATHIIVVTHASGVLIGTNILLGNADKYYVDDADPFKQQERTKHYAPVRMGTGSVTELQSTNGEHWEIVRNGDTHHLTSGELHNFDHTVRITNTPTTK